MKLSEVKTIFERKMKRSERSKLLKRLQRKGPCRVLTLSPDSEEWADLASISDSLLYDLRRKRLYSSARNSRLHGYIKGRIFAWANA